MNSADREKGHIHYAKLDNSERLWKVLRLLMLGPHTTRQLQQRTGLTGTTATISELKRNGVPVISTPIGRTREYSLPKGQLDLTMLMPE